MMRGPELLSRWAAEPLRRNLLGRPWAPRLTLRIKPGPLLSASAMADGEDVGAAVVVMLGRMRASGNMYEGTAGKEQLVMGTMPSGVEERLPLRPKCEEVLAGLPRAEGMAIARA